MTSILEWLFDLEHIQLGRDAPLLLKWSDQVEAWMLLCVAVLAVGMVALIFRREGGSSKQRCLLACLRLSLIALVVAMLCRPSIVLQRNRVEQAHVMVLVDSSASMATADHYDDEALAAHVATGGLVDIEDLSDRTRLSLAQSALSRDAGAPLQALLTNNVVQLASFDRNTVRLARASDTGELADLVDRMKQIQAVGSKTDIAGALHACLDETQGSRLAAIVLVTDGQASVSTNLATALEAVHGRQVPVYPIRLGSPKPLTQVTVGPVLADAHVFQNDIVAISAKITTQGLKTATKITLELTEDNQAVPLQRMVVNMDPSEPIRTITLTTKPSQLGTHHYQVRALPLPHEKIIDDNSDAVEVMVVEGRIRVLYVDAYPRYEYRYLKNALLREKTNELSVLLLGADENFVQEGTVAIRRFPETPEELNRFDVVLMGDVDPKGSWLTDAQMNMLLDFVGHEGGGFGVIAGERSAPLRFAGTPLEKLLPVYIDSHRASSSGFVFPEGFRMQLTPQGRHSRLFRAISTTALQPVDTTEVADFFGSLPKLYWLANTLGAKPGAIVLAEHPTMKLAGQASAGSANWPVLVLGRYGAGSVFFQGSDDTWRWRRHHGEFLHDTFWVQVVRELAKVERRFSAAGLVIRTDRRTYDYGQPVQVHVEVRDTKLLAGQVESIPLEVREQIMADSDDHSNVGDRVSRVVLNIDASKLTNQSNIYQASFVPPRAGKYTIQSILLTGSNITPLTSARFGVATPSLETRRLEANHETLEQMAAATGGQVIELDQLDEAFAAIPDRSVRIPDDITEPLWDSKIVLMLFVFAISTEWILRKMFGLI